MPSMPKIIELAPSWVAVDKPAGWLCVPPRHSENRAPGTELLGAWLERELGRRVWTVHRLDRETSGVWIAALSAESHRELSKAFEARRVKKRYEAILKGVPPWPAHVYRSPIRDQACQTSVRVKARTQDSAWVSVEPRTGRMHQIRIHLAEGGYPIRGDSRYGTGAEPEFEISRTLLHAQSLSLILPGEASERVLEAPLAPDFLDALERLGLSS